jgi:3-oxo-5alpha-steroid 4-dehydrogenase
MIHSVHMTDDVIKNSPLYPCPGLTLGGLQVNEETGELLDEKGNSIPGIYATGRSAVGVRSNNYISGLSLADGIFSGRRVGGHVAMTAKTASSPGLAASS